MVAALIGLANSAAAQANFLLTVTSDRANYTSAGQVITYAFGVINVGTVPLSIDYFDSTGLLVDMACPLLTVPAGNVVICQATYTTSAANLAARTTITETVTVGMLDGTTALPTKAVTKSVPFLAQPAATVGVSRTPSAFTSPGQVINYSFLLNNTGNIDFSSFALTDTRATGISCPATTLARGASMSCTGSYTTTIADVTAAVALTGSTSLNATAVDASTAAPATATSSVAYTALQRSAVVGTATTPTTFNTSGQVIAYSFPVINNGDVDIASFTVTDTRASSISCPSSTIARGTSVTCTGSYATTAGDVSAAAALTSTTTVSGRAIDAMPITVAPATSSVAFEPNLNATLTTAFTPNSFARNGDTLSFTYTVRNTGNQTLTNIAVTDAVSGPKVCGSTTLAMGQTTQCTSQYAANTLDIQAGALTLRPVLFANGPLGQQLRWDSPLQTIVMTLDPRWFINATVSSFNFNSGDVLTYSYYVRNDGNAPISNIALSNTVGATVSCPGNTLAVAANMTCTASYQTTASDTTFGRTISNTVTATGTTTGNSAMPTLAVAAPDVTSNTFHNAIITAAGPTNFTGVGQQIVFNYGVTFSAITSELLNIAVSDTLNSTIVCPKTALRAFETVACTGTYTTTAADVARGRIDSTVTVVSTLNGPPVATEQMSASVLLQVQPSIAVTRSTTPAVFGMAGQTIAYSFVVTNTGSTSIAPITVTNSKAGPAACQLNVLAVGGSTTCTATYTTTNADVTAGSISDTVTATGTPASGTLTPAIASGTIAFLAQPSWTVSGSVNPATFSAIGETKLVTIVIANTGNVPVNGISIDSGASCPLATLAPGATMNCTHAYVTSNIDISTAGFIGFSLRNYTAATTTSGIPSQPISIRLNYAAPAPSMTVSTSASPSVFSTSNQSINYTFTVRNTGTVGISALALTDTRVIGISCLASTLAVGDSTTCAGTYLTTAADVSAGRGLANTVTARGTPTGGSLANATATGSVEFLAQPSWSVSSTPSQPTYSVSPTLLRYTHFVQNTGSVAISSISISDSRAVATACPQSTLAVGANMNCTAEYMVAASDVASALNLVNTVTLRGSALPGTLADATATSTVSFLGQPALTLTNSANPGGFIAAGAANTIILNARNAGNVSITNLAATSTKGGVMACDVTTLAPTDAASCTVVYTTLAADVGADIVFTVSVTGTPASGTLNSATSVGTIVYTAAPTITSTLPSAVFGQAYAPPTLTATGGRAPYSFLASGLPAGLVISGAGAVTGTPTQAGTFTVQVQIRDSSSGAIGGPFFSAVTPLTLVVAPPSVAVSTASLPAGGLGLTYAAPALAASGGSSPYTFTAAGLPTGLTLNASTGVISGTPTQAGSFAVDVTAMDATTAAVGGPFSSPAKALTLTIAAPTIAVTSTTLPNATYGNSYTSPALTATGGTAPRTFAATGLPPGLTLNASTGVISGSPTVAGTFTVNVTVTDSSTVANGGPFVSSAKALSLTVAPPTMTVGGINSPVWTFGTFSNTAVTFSANGPVVQPLKMTVSGLPNGISGGGVVLGGTPTQAGTFPVTVQFTDSTPVANGGPFTTPPKTLTVTVLPPTILVTTASLPNAAFGVAYAAPALAASGGTGPRTFVATGLPNGMNLNASTGVISGTPVASGTFTVNVTATDGTTVANGGPFASASKALSLVVGSPTVTVSTSTLPAGRFGATYSAPALTATGGTGPYAFTANGLPAGLTLNASTGAISGTPTQAGTFNVFATATDATTAANGGPFVSASATLSLTVAPATVAVTTSNLPGAIFGTTYSAPALVATGGTAPYSFAVSGLPFGLALNATTGVVSGLPTQSGVFNISVTATDATPAASGGPFVSVAKAVTITVESPAVAVTTSSLPSGTFGSAYSAAALTATGGTAPHRYAATGLPAGLALDAATGIISGTPQQAGSFNAAITATDATTAANGGPFVSPARGFALTIAPPSVQVATSSLTAASFGVAYASPALAATGGTGPHRFAATGLPAGLTLDAATGVISGTPTASGNFTVSVIATDATGAANGGPFVSAAKSLALSVASPTIAVVTRALPAATFGASYTAPAITVTGGTSPYRFSATGLPAGLSIAVATGIVSGTPTAAGSFNISVVATDATAPASGGPFNSTASVVTLTVAAPSVVVSAATLPSATFGVAYNASALTAAGGSGPYVFAATGLPIGLTMAASGSISGTPTAAGTFTISVTATDATSAALGGPFVSGVRTMTLIVSAPTLAVTTTALPNGKIASAYPSLSLGASGGTQPYSFAVTGLPAGMSATAQGVISGTPTEAGSFTIGVTVSDSTGMASGGPFASALANLILSIAPSDTSITLTSSPNPALAGGSVTFAATVTPATATGTVTFATPTTPIGTVNLANGIAALTTSTLAVGTHAVTAVYNGNSTTASSTSSTLSQTISGSSAWTMSKSSTPSTFTAAGQTISTRYVLTNTGGGAISSIAVTDARAAPVSCPSTSIAVGTSMTCAGSFVTTAADVTARSIVASASATGVAELGTLAPLTASATTAFLATTGNLTVAVRAPGLAGNFAFSSTIPGNGSFTLTPSSGSGSRTMSAVAAGSYQLSLTSVPPQAMLTSIDCGGAISSANAVTVVVTAGQSMTCTASFALNTQSARTAIQNEARENMKRRAETLLSAQPDRGRMFGRLFGSWFGSSNDDAPPAPVSSNVTGSLAHAPGDAQSSLEIRPSAANKALPALRPSITSGELDHENGHQAGPGFIGVTGSYEEGSGSGRAWSSLAQFLEASRAMEAAKERAALSSLGQSMRAKQSQGGNLMSKFDVWMEVQATATTQRYETGKRTGNMTVGFLGADYVLNPAFLVGALVQFDWGQEQARGSGTNSAQGWMAGPYAATKITPNLFADARAAWGRGVSKITVTDFGEEDFDSSRQLLFARLNGQWQYGAWRFSPSISVSHYKETQQAFDSKTGGSIPAQTLSLGRVTFGPEIGYAARLAGGVAIEPTFGVKGIWSFLDKETSGGATDPGDFTLRFEAGTQIRLPSGVVLQGGGAVEGQPNGRTSVQGQARINVPLR